MADKWFLLAVLAVTVLAVVWDLAERRIPNAITLAAIVGGLAGHAIVGGPQGLAWSAGGLAVGLALLAVPVIMGGMGAGDLKLMGAVGALVGPRLAFEIALASGIAGGVLALVEAVRRGVLRPALGRAVGLLMPWRKRPTRSGGGNPNEGAGDLGSIPYGVAIGMGTWICVLWRGAW